MNSKKLLLLAVALFVPASMAYAQTTKPAQWGYQYPPPDPDPSKAGYKDREGNLKGNCRNFRHRPHEHCKNAIAPARAKPSKKTIQTNKVSE